jgi:hypothetical protein
MKELVEHIINKNYDAASQSLEESFSNVMREKLHEMKKMYAAKIGEQNTHNERMKRLRIGVLEEDDIEEALLKVSKDKPKLVSPTARANMNLEEENSFVLKDRKTKEVVGTYKTMEDAAAARTKKGGTKETHGIYKQRHMGALKNRMSEETDHLDEQTRVGIVKVRVRGGKIQRRKKVSNVPGMTLRGGKLERMSPAERRKRKLGAKVAARKSRSKRNQSLRKRKMSLMKRARLGG